jgi:DNA polymerase bacteriophage-type
MNIVTLDFETYFDQEYSLSEMTTEAYVRDPRFEAHGCSFKFYSDISAHWFDGHLVKTVLDGIDWSQTACLCHHAQFDGLILSHHYGIKPALWLDTLSMAHAVLGPHIGKGLGSLAQHYGIGVKDVPYNLFKGKHWHELDRGTRDAVAAGCCRDVELTWHLFCLLAEGFPPDEYQLVDETMCLFTEPVLVGNAPVLDAVYQEEREAKDALLKELGATTKELRQNKIFIELLENEGVEIKWKNGKNKEIPCFAKTDQFMRDLLDDENPRVAMLAEARLDAASNLTLTRTARLRGMAERGKLCVYLNYCGAHTRRWSGGDKMNWQNFRRGSRLGYGIGVEPGNVVVVRDASQIECRMLNMTAGQADVIEKFRRKEDPYVGNATKFYGHAVYKPALGDPRYDEMEAKRGFGKQLELSCGYGAGGPSIVATAKRGNYGPPILLTAEEGIQARDIYREGHPFVVDLWGQAKRMIPAIAAGEHFWPNWIGEVRDKKLYLPNGLWLDYSTLHWDAETQEWRVASRNGGWTKLYGAKLVENWIQAIAACHLRTVWLACRRASLRVVSSEHDKLICVCRESEAKAAAAFLHDELCRPPVWMPDLPLDSEGYISHTYAKETTK